MPSEFKKIPSEKTIVVVKKNFERVLIVGLTKDGMFFAAGNASSEQHLADVAEFQRRLEEDDWDEVDDEFEGVTV